MVHSKLASQSNLYFPECPNPTVLPTYWSLSFAAAIEIMIPIMIFMMLMQRHLVRGLAMGGIEVMDLTQNFLNEVDAYLNLWKVGRYILPSSRIAPCLNWPRHCAIRKFHIPISLINTIIDRYGRTVSHPLPIVVLQMSLRHQPRTCLAFRLYSEALLT